MACFQHHTDSSNATRDQASAKVGNARRTDAGQNEPRRRPSRTLKSGVSHIPFSQGGLRKIDSLKAELLSVGPAFMQTNQSEMFEYRGPQIKDTDLNTLICSHTVDDHSHLKRASKIKLSVRLVTRQLHQGRPTPKWDKTRPIRMKFESTSRDTDGYIKAVGSLDNGFGCLLRMLSHKEARSILSEISTPRGHLFANAIERSRWHIASGLHTNESKGTSQGCGSAARLPLTKVKIDRPRPKTKQVCKRQTFDHTTDWSRRYTHRAVRTDMSNRYSEEVCLTRCLWSSSPNGDSIDFQLRSPIKGASAPPRPSEISHLSNRVPRTSAARASSYQARSTDGYIRDRSGYIGHVLNDSVSHHHWQCDTTHDGLAKSNALSIATRQTRLELAEYGAPPFGVHKLPNETGSSLTYTTGRLGQFDECKDVLYRSLCGNRLQENDGLHQHSWTQRCRFWDSIRLDNSASAVRTHPTHAQQHWSLYGQSAKQAKVLEHQLEGKPSIGHPIRTQFYLPAVMGTVVKTIEIRAVRTKRFNRTASVPNALGVA